MAIRPIRQPAGLVAMLHGMSDREAALRVLAALQRTPIGDAAILVGSSGLFGFTTRVPALTEDIYVAIPEHVVDDHGREIVEALARLGFAHEAGTATFVADDGTTFDLLGHGAPTDGDHIGGTEPLRVMVFEDLSRVAGDAGASAPLEGGGRALTPAGFVATKLLTERAHKGTKDKIQALLVLAERRGDSDFEAQLLGLLQMFDAVRLEDMRAAAQDALIALSDDPRFTDAGAEGYAAMRSNVAAGRARLEQILEERRG